MKSNGKEMTWTKLSATGLLHFVWFEAVNRFTGSAFLDWKNRLGSGLIANK